MTTRLIIGSLLVLVVAAPAQAQTARGFLSVNGAYQATTTRVTSTVGFTAYLEPATAESTFSVKPGVAFDVTVGARVFGVFAVGAGVSRFTRSQAADVTASIPHPFFFNQPRTITGQSGSLVRSEMTAHLEIGALISKPKLMVGIFVGPSYFTVEQDLVSTVSYSDAFPYDTATFTSAPSARATASKLGYHALVDIGVMLSRRVGVGMSVRYSQATVTLAAADGTTTSVKVGGAIVGGGLRVRF
jgi:hypothetical protein